MTILFPTRATDDELRFAHSRAVSLAIGLIGAAGAVLFYTLLPDSPVRLAFTAMAALTALPLLAGGLRRYELVIDLATRQWRRGTGFVLAPRNDSGSLDDVNGVALELRHVRSGSGTSGTSVPMWSVWLEFAAARRDGDRVCIGVIERDEPRAYRLLEHYARRMRIDAIDRTATEPQRRAWHALGAPAATSAGADTLAVATSSAPGTLPPATSAASFASAAPPTRYGIEVTRDEAGNPRLLLPPHGFGATTAVAFVLAIGSGAAGVVMVAGALGFGPVASGVGAAGPQAVPLVVGGMFIAVALSAIRAAISRARSREWVVELPDALRFGITRGGMARGYTELPKHGIEEVSVRTPAAGGSRLHVFGFRVRLDGPESAVVRVRTDHDVVRLGRRLTPDAKQWLRDTIAACVGVAAG